jgi:hypothetical protein
LSASGKGGWAISRVDVRLTNNREIKDAVVFKAEDIELPDDCAHSAIEDIRCTADRQTCAKQIRNKTVQKEPPPIIICTEALV